MTHRKTTNSTAQNQQQKPEQPVLATDCAVFIGRVDTTAIAGALPAQPVFLTDWQAYVQQFGGFVWDQFLAFAVYSFFQGGGSRCYVVPGVASESRPGEMAYADASSIRLQAASAGTWANGLLIQVSDVESPSTADQPTAACSIRVLMPAMEQAKSDQASAAEQRLAAYVAKNHLPTLTLDETTYVVLETLTAVPREGASMQAVLQAQSFFLRVGAIDGTPSLANGSYLLAGGAEGAWEYAESSLSTAIAALPEFGLLAIPDNVGNSIAQQQYVLSQWLATAASQNQFFVVADPPFDLDVHAVIDFNSKTDVDISLSSSFGAMYYPWLWMRHPVTGKELLVPPSGACLGCYAETDQVEGVWVTPAGVSAGSLKIATGVGRDLDIAEMDQLTAARINAIANKGTYGYVIWGGRTMVMDDPDWQFIPVRRLVNFIMQSLTKAIAWTALKTNTPTVRQAVRHEATTILTDLWRQGALFGAKPDEAFKVICDDTNNFPADVETGRLVVEVLIAPEKPAQYLSLQLEQAVQPEVG